MQQTMKYTSRIMKFINISILQFHGIPWNYYQGKLYKFSFDPSPSDPDRRPPSWRRHFQIHFLACCFQGSYQQLTIINSDDDDPRIKYLLN